MKAESMTNDWRTVQLFLGDNGISEVEVNQHHKNQVRCTCAAFKLQSRCPHTKRVKKEMQANDGHYTVHIPVELDEAELVEAMETAEAFREFIIRYGKVEVL